MQIFRRKNSILLICSIASRWQPNTTYASKEVINLTSKEIAKHERDLVTHNLVFRSSVLRFPALCLREWAVYFIHVFINLFESIFTIKNMQKSLDLLIAVLNLY